MERFEFLINKAQIDHKPHQYDAVRWCIDNEINGRLIGGNIIRGGFLADEMGLGKTIVMIGLFFSNFLKNTLIILPAPLIQQWVNEIKRITNHNVLVYHGKNKKNITIEDLEKAPFVIATYNAIIVRKDEVPSNASLLHKIKWKRIIFDEAHHLRNKNSRNWGANILKSNIKWLISGTPIQNKIKDIVNLCAIVKIPTNTMIGGIYKNMPQIIELFCLRRTKKQIGINIPDLKINNVSIPWKNVNEKNLAEDIHLSYISCKNNNKLRLLNNAKQICILPELIENQKMTYLFENKLISDNKNKYNNATTFTSKLDIVISTILSHKGNGNGKLVFCHFHKEMDTLVKRLKEGGIEKINTFDGRISSKEKNKRLHEKNEVLILQIQTGCEGLNLQDDYSEIYFVSPNWNPAIEDQAIARCHRIGQLKEVSVYKFKMKSIVQEPNINDSDEQKEEKKEPISTLDKYINYVQREKRKIYTRVFEIIDD